MKFDAKTWKRIYELAGRDAGSTGAAPGECRICSCTDERPCPEGCAWVDESRTLCSSCAVLIDDRFVRELRRQSPGPDESEDARGVFPAAVPEDFRREFESLAHRRPLLLKLTQLQGWILLSALQLALRHPTFPESLAVTVECVARTLQVNIATTPALARIAEQGWDPAHDAEAG